MGVGVGVGVVVVVASSSSSSSSSRSRTSSRSSSNSNVFTRIGTRSTSSPRNRVALVLELILSRWRATYSATTTDAAVSGPWRRPASVHKLDAHSLCILA